MIIVDMEKKKKKNIKNKIKQRTFIPKEQLSLLFQE